MSSSHTQQTHRPTHITGAEAAEELTVDSHVGIVDSAIAPGVEDEKCVVAIYRTTVEQKEKLVAHLATRKWRLSMKVL